MPDTFQFDEQFERRLLAFLVRDIKFFLRNGTLIREVYFDSDFNRDIFRIAGKYVETYQKVIPRVELRNEITKMYREQQKKDIAIDEYWTVVERVYSEDLTTGDKYSEDVLLEYVRRKEMGSALVKGMERLVSRQDLNPILSDVTQALSIGNKMQLGYDYFAETAVRTSKAYEGRETVSTGIGRLDRLLAGGLAVGEFGVIVAPTSRGKTALMINFAFGALKRRKNVIYVCLEGLDEDVGMRFDQLISQTGRDELSKESDKVRDHVMYVDKLLKSKLIIKMFPTDSVGVSDIDQYISHEQIVRGFEADLIVIDYLNLCKRDKREETWWGTSYREGKAMAVRRRKPVWTAAQARNDALRDKVVHASQIAESTNRIKSDSDVIVCVCQTMEEEEKKDDPTTLRLYLDKNRNNPAKRQIPMLFNRAMMIMEEDKGDGTPVPEQKS